MGGGCTADTGTAACVPREYLAKFGRFHSAGPAPDANMGKCYSIQKSGSGATSMKTGAARARVAELTSRPVDPRELEPESEKYEFPVARNFRSIAGPSGGGRRFL